TYVSPLFPSGTVDVYRQGSQGWQVEAQLTSSNPVAGMRFGYSVAIGPDLIVVGSYYPSSLTTFERSGSTWTEVDTMPAWVAHDVGLSNDTLVSAGTVYLRNGSGWQIQQALPTDGQYGLDNAAIDGDLIVSAGTAFSLISPPHAAFFYSRSGDVWTPEGEVALDLSYYPVHVAMSGHTALVSVPSDTTGTTAVRVFDRDDQGVWQDSGVLDPGTDLQGEVPVLIEGDVAFVGSPSDGTAYRFTRSAGVWTRDRHFNDPSYSLCFVAIALSGSNLLAGCPNGVTPSGGIGKADIFSLDSDPPPVVAQFDQGNSFAGEALGNPAVLSGSTLAVGGVQGTFLFDDGASGWERDAFLAFPVNYDSWNAIALDGDTLAAGFRSYAFDGRDAVGVYVGSGSTWTPQAFLEGGGAHSGFGSALALLGDTLIVDEPDVACHVYSRSGSTWSEIAPLQPAESTVGDGFCDALAIDGDTVLVGAPHANTGIETNAGAAYVFVRSNGVWNEQARLVAPLIASNAQFGASVDLRGNTAVVGAVNGDAQTSTRGAAYVYARSGNAWTVQATLQDLVGAVPGDFGYRVGIAGSQDKILVGAPVGAPDRPDDGIVYVFAFDGAAWSASGTIEGAPPFEVPAGDQFGTSISFTGDTFAIGAPNDGISGAVYVGSTAETIFANGFDPPP
ncbi:MAG TPA: hypothetical protein VG871_11860, partial [Vicinamibacterales bacterium]|nr:hypothetical protein [Vicinamibacterales bacterium]